MEMDDIEKEGVTHRANSERQEVDGIQKTAAR